MTLKIRVKNYILLVLCCLGANTGQAGQRGDSDVVKQIIVQSISSSQVIFEGEVLTSQAYWDSAKTYIYTANVVKVDRIWKNEGIVDFPDSETVVIITHGGTVGETSLHISHNIYLGFGQKGMFMCKPADVDTDPDSEIEQSFHFVLNDGVFLGYDDSQGYITTGLGGQIGSYWFECIDLLYKMINSSYVVDCPE